MGVVMHLVRDVLDNRLMDREGRPMGRVDGLVLVIRDGGRPELRQIETGLVTLGWRLGPRVGRWVVGVGRRFGVRGGRVLRVGWGKVRKVDIDVEVDVDAEEAGALAWERWVRERFTRHVPGSR